MSSPNVVDPAKGGVFIGDLFKRVLTMKLVITGAQGQLGLAFARKLERKGISFWGCDYTACDITKKEQVVQMLDAQKPSVLINCAAYNFVDDAENNRMAAFAVNSDAVRILGDACQARGIKLVHYSSDYVFDGKKGSLYIEEDTANPLNVYGHSKYEGEKALRMIGAHHLVLRTSWVYGRGQQNFLYKVSQWVKKSEVLKISVDEISVPTFVDDIVSVTLKALDKGMTGLYHLTSSGYASRYEWVKTFITAAGLSKQVTPQPMSSFSLKAQRPLFSAMSNCKISKELGIQIPNWQEGVEKYVRSMEGK